MSSSLSSVVSGLVRAQMGTSVGPTVTDDDLDKAVAELILKEAKKKADLYRETGIKAYLRDNFNDTNAPRTNKRFLTSIIKSTDDHNKTLLRAQAEAAYDIKKARDDAERSERRARAEEAVLAEYDRRHGRRRDSHRRERDRDSRRSKGKGKERERERSRSPREEDEDEAVPGLKWDRWDGRTASRKRKARDWEAWDGSRSDSDSGTDDARRTKAKSRRSESHSRTLSEDDDHDRRRRRHHRHHRSSRRHRSPSHPPSPSRSASPDASGEREIDLKRKLHAKRRAAEKTNKAESSRRKRSPSPWSKRLIAAASYDPHASTSESSHLRTPSPGPEPLPYVPSKMDRYFHEDYDPRLDVEHMTVPTVPATGLISDAEFASWDAMLDALRAREDRKRAGLSRNPFDTSSSPKKSSSLGSGMASASAWGDQPGLMDIQYKKKGAVREWDMGKETPT